MRVKQMLGVSLCALVLSNAFDVQAADDSYVDLSVLNSLQPGDSLFVETQPLFPIVKKDTSAPAKVKKAKKKAVKKQSSKSLKQEVKKETPAPVNKESVKSQATKAEVKTPETSKPEEKIEILPQTPAIPQPLADKKDAEKAETPANTMPEAMPQALNQTETPAPTAPQSETTTTSAEQGAQSSAQPESNAVLTPAPAVSSQLPQANAPQKTEPSEAKEVMPQQAVAQPAVTTQEVTTSSTSAPATAPSVTAPIAEQPAQKVVEPLIPQASTSQATADKEGIRFDEGSYEISAENEQKILSLIASFENPQKNKIAIYAYNYDNGENSFKKKKLSLDRATEIRSLLLNKGYKNFSIKVINVTDSPDKNNLVEIEEIK